MLPENRFAGQLGALGGDVAPHGTTIVAVTFDGGVLIAGDRRATMGSLIASRDVDKVHITDEYSAAGIAGTAGLAVEMVRLFAVELEHYEKIEGVPLTFDGKANRLSSMVRGNLGAACRGWPWCRCWSGSISTPPIRTGRAASSRTTWSAAGTRNAPAITPSGRVRCSRSRRSRSCTGGDADEQYALRSAVEALYDAADDDSGTGGPDTTRGIYPTAAVITGTGATLVPETTLSELARAIVADRTAGGGQ